jgi:large subunit ribosomal protein L9
VKVVFIEDVPDVALAGQTKEVADGYGRNYLLPKKLAVLADSAASNILKSQMKQVMVKRAEAESEMKDIAGKVNGAEITIKAKAGEKDRLYGSVTSADIAAELGNIAGQAIDKRKIDLEEPIRQLGVYEVALKFTHDITAAIMVTVESEEAVAEVGEKEEKEEKKKPRARKAKKAEEAEAVAEEAVAGVEAEVKAEEAEAKVEELEIKLDEAEVTGVKAEETEAKAEETETKPKKPKARKKTTKKAEAKVEEKESGE